MVAFAVTQGVMLGHEYYEKGMGVKELRLSFWMLYFFYMGALMCAPEAMRRVVPSYPGYAAATVCAGAAMVIVSAFLATLAFRVGNRFLLGPGPAKPETRAAKK